MAPYLHNWRLTTICCTIVLGETYTYSELNYTECCSKVYLVTNCSILSPERDFIARQCNLLTISESPSLSSNLM
jgi:hypothetical protein